MSCKKNELVKLILLTGKHVIEYIEGDPKKFH